MTRTTECKQAYTDRLDSDVRTAPPNDSQSTGRSQWEQASGDHTSIDDQSEAALQPEQTATYKDGGRGQQVAENQHPNAGDSTRSTGTDNMTSSAASGEENDDSREYTEQVIGDIEQSSDASPPFPSGPEWSANKFMGRPHLDAREGSPPGNEGTRPGSYSQPDYAKWPYPAKELKGDIARIYDQVRATNAHNHEKARITLETSLKLEVWGREATGHADNNMVLQGLRFGFPIQYRGPPKYADNNTTNHQTAVSHPRDVMMYINKEKQYGALAGPFDQPPFTPWFVTSPLMTREKADSNERRVIVDLSFPDGGINQHIQSHMFNGLEATHNLPTVDVAVGTIANMCPGEIQMAVLDLSRAYCHFPVSPLDWPLLGICHDQSMYFDMRIPFGSRMSSYIMQSIAQYIVRALHTRKIVAHMYLDDIILITPSKAKATIHYEQALTLLNELGLQVTQKKLQPPSRKSCSQNRPGGQGFHLQNPGGIQGSRQGQDHGGPTHKSGPAMVQDIHGPVQWQSHNPNPLCSRPDMGRCLPEGSGCGGWEVMLHVRVPAGVGKRPQHKRTGGIKLCGSSKSLRRQQPRGWHSGDPLRQPKCSGGADIWTCQKHGAGSMCTGHVVPCGPQRRGSQIQTCAGGGNGPTRCPE